MIGLTRRRMMALVLALGAMPARALAIEGRPPLRRGIALSHWLQYGGRQTVGAEDMDLLRASGFDHVRLPVDPLFLGWRPSRPDILPGLDRVHSALDLALGHGLDVILDLHPEDNLRRPLEEDPELEPAFAALWRILARSAAAHPDRIAVEVLNEPQYYGRAGRRWPQVQERLLAAIRHVAPDSLALLSGAQGGSAEGLAALPPSTDPATAYVFHYYLPYLFTHQGADWMAEDKYTAAAHVRRLDYPAAQALLPQDIAADQRKRVEREFARYRAEDWRAERIARDIGIAASWAAEHGRRVLCTEFGVLRTHADPVSRYRWLADCRIALEAAGFGWSLWDYADIFGVTEDGAMPRRLEEGAIAALGLEA